jgi:hypothetical protein
MDLTLREYDYLVQRYLREQEQSSYKVALVCSVIANCHKDPKQKPFKPEDFMPRKPQTQKEQMQMVEFLNIAFGGEDRRAQ